MPWSETLRTKPFPEMTDAEFEAALDRMCAEQEAEKRSANAAMLSAFSAAERAAYDKGVAAGRAENFWLEHELAIMTQRAFGYVNRTATIKPGDPKPRQYSEWRKLRHRVPYVLNADGTSRRVRGQIKREDYVRAIPPRVCEHAAD